MFFRVLDSSVNFKEIPGNPHLTSGI